MFNNCVMAMYLLSLAIFPPRDYYLLMYTMMMITVGSLTRGQDM